MTSFMAGLISSSFTYLRKFVYNSSSEFMRLVNVDCMLPIMKEWFCSLEQSKSSVVRGILTLSFFGEVDHARYDWRKSARNVQEPFEKRRCCLYATTLVRRVSFEIVLIRRIQTQEIMVIVIPLLSHLHAQIHRIPIPKIRQLPTPLQHDHDLFNRVISLFIRLCVSLKHLEL